MGMATPTKHERAQVTIKLQRTEDEELTCVVCCRDKCAWEFQAFVHGKRTWSGIHDACARLAGVLEIMQ